MKLVKYLLFLSVIFFPLGLLASFKLIGTPDVRIVFLDVLVGLIVLAWYSKHFEKRVLEAWWFVGVAGLSLLVNIPKYELWQVGVGSLYLLRFVAYTGLIYVLKDLKLKLRSALVWLGVSVAGLGLVQYGLYPNLRNLQYLGWDPHLSRLFGTFLDPQFTGIILVLTLILLFSNRKGLGLKKAIYIGIVEIALVLTFSRSSYLAFMLGMGILALGRKMSKAKLGIGIFVAVLLIILLKPAGIAGDLLRVDTVDSRIDSWLSAVEVWKSSPVLGVGLNMYRYVQDFKGPSISASRLAFDNNAGAGVDNSFLFVLATTGVVGLVAYLIYWGSLLKNVSIEGLAVTSALLTHGLFNNTLFYPWVLWWIAVYFSNPRESS